MSYSVPAMVRVYPVPIAIGIIGATNSNMGVDAIPTKEKCYSSTSGIKLFNARPTGHPRLNDSVGRAGKRKEDDEPPGRTIVTFFALETALFTFFLDKKSNKKIKAKRSR